MQNRTLVSVLGVLALLYFGPGVFVLGFPRDADACGLAASATLTTPGEPGVPLHVSGTVYGDDGSTPLPGVELYVYHTDDEGYYSPGTDDNSNPRLKATLQTDGDGRYEFRTIKPAPYPGGSVPAHIHYVLSGAGYPEQRRDLHFEGDPHLSERARERSRQAGRFGSIRPVEEGADGVLRVTYDLRLRK